MMIDDIMPNGPKKEKLLASVVAEKEKVLSSKTESEMKSAGSNTEEIRNLSNCLH